MKRRTRKKLVSRVIQDMRRGHVWWQGWHMRWHCEPKEGNGT